jgi:hypothetical protein
MTRINANIKPEHLIDQHLLAEYREMVRIPNAVNKSYQGALKAIEKAPKLFKLNTGHVTFFYDKLLFLHRRFNAIKRELTKRGIANNMTDSMFLNLPVTLYNDTNLDYANKIVFDRILIRMSNMKRITYHGKPMTISEYQTLITN